MKKSWEPPYKRNKWRHISVKRDRYERVLSTTWQRKMDKMTGVLIVNSACVCCHYGKWWCAANGAADHCRTSGHSVAVKYGSNSSRNYLLALQANKFKRALILHVIQNFLTAEYIRKQNWRVLSFFFSVQPSLSLTVFHFPSSISFSQSSPTVSGMQIIVFCLCQLILVLLLGILLAAYWR